jgi:hypothetical protein
MAKQYGIKNEMLLGMSYGTHKGLGKHFGNMMGTHCEQKKTKNLHPPKKNLKRKKLNALSYFIGYMKFLF